MREKQKAFRGAMLGLAVGDAMGSVVDRKSMEEICDDYGPNGLLGYDLANGYAEVSSYTQLAAFTANALLLGLTRRQVQNRNVPLVRYVGVALREWSRSQQYSTPERNYCWLSSEPELKRRRCMDTRMLDALSREALGTPENIVYRNDHPSALTEVLPAALLGSILEMEADEVDLLSAEIVALTHGDPQTFICGAILAHALCALSKQPDISAEELLQDTVDSVSLQFSRQYGGCGHIWELFQMAQIFAKSDDISSIEAMERLGCRTAPEVLAGVLYSCLTCRGDFDAAMITAVNHSGRSAAVAAITGAILGLRLGEDALPDFYMESLEPTELLREIADDLSQASVIHQRSRLYDDDWDRKYLHASF